MPPARVKTPPPWVVFTDLDGTLLDARTYEVGPARQALDRLAAHGVPVVFCSSKTAAEQHPLRIALGLTHTPFIVENGSAVFVPDSSGLSVADWSPASNDRRERVRILGRPAAAVRNGIARAAGAARLKVTGYGDLSLRQVAGLTGLKEDAAARARQRDYSETLVDAFPAEDWLKLDPFLEAEGLCRRHGGRFHTVTAAAADKGAAVRVVIELFTAAGHAPPLTVGLGDSANDESMLMVVDRPYLLAREDGTWARIDRPALRRMARPGPLGWHDAALDFFAAIPTSG